MRVVSTFIITPGQTKMRVDGVLVDQSLCESCLNLHHYSWSNEDES